MEVHPGSPFFHISPTYTQLYEQIKIICFQRMKDTACSLPFILPLSSGKAEKNPGTLFYPSKILDDTPD